MPESCLDEKSLDVIKDVAKEVAKDVYADAGKPIAKPTGELLGLVPRAIKAALEPVEKWVLQREYNIAETKLLLEKKLENVYPELIEVPEPFIAVPALQYISYCMDNEELRDMYATLLANSMNKVVKKGVHPAFIEIIKQLSPDEAKILRYIYRNKFVPIIGLDVIKKAGSHLEVYKFFSDITEICGCEDVCGYERYFDNLTRLGLIVIPGNEYLADKTVYDALKKHPFITAAKARIEGRPDVSCVNYKEKHLELSSLGQAFCRICIE